MRPDGRGWRQMTCHGRRRRAAALRRGHAPRPLLPPTIAQTRMTCGTMVWRMHLANANTAAPRAGSPTYYSRFHSPISPGGGWRRAGSHLTTSTSRLPTCGALPTWRTALCCDVAPACRTPGANRHETGVAGSLWHIRGLRASDNSYHISISIPA